MSYIRPLGDGPITHPDPLPPDDETGDPIATVTPIRRDCSELAADSPWRRPGQVCAPPADLLDVLRGLIGGGSAGATSPPIVDPAVSSAASDTSLLWYVAAGGVAYYLYRQYGKRRRA